MTAFSYQAINAQGLELKRRDPRARPRGGARAAAPARPAAAEARRAPASGEGARRAVLKKVKPKSLQIFSRQFATMIEAGVSVVSALATLEEQTDDKYLAKVIGEVRADVEAGMILSQRVRRAPEGLQPALRRDGRGGRVVRHARPRARPRSRSRSRRTTQIKRRVKSAMVYPIVVLSFASLVLTFMLMFIVPVFKKIFDAAQRRSCRCRRRSSWTSRTCCARYWFIIFPLIGALDLRASGWKKTEQGRQIWDRFKLRIPMKIGDVVPKIALARFSRTLSTLVSAGRRHRQGARDHRQRPPATG